jgi:serine/threonine protein kinase/Tol biopolymer transport system component
MPLTSGTKIGSYEIGSLLGVGGMGEVYRSRDSKLGREVALKVLPSSVAADPGRLARFSREAKLLAALNHPNIAAIYGLEDSGGSYALVMELVEGPTLADSIKAGRIPSDEALPIAKQICEAFEYAHDRGIVHRDLKPANVKVTREDTVKVLDFGLAKALENEATSADISSSPTMSRLATQAGIILGTAAYMSPEQARGKSVDRRADIWAFGCVLYEMLTGKMAFDGETVSDTLAAVIKENPDWDQLPASTSTRIRVLVQRCLQKDPRQRLQAIGDARIVIDEVLSGAPETGPVVQQIVKAPAVPAWRRFLPWGIAAALALAVLLSLFSLRQASHPSENHLLLLSLSIPSDQKLDTMNGPAFAISPDGSRIAYVTGGPGSGQVYHLYLREMDKRDAMLLEGAGSAASPFFSPDGQWIGFFSEGKLKKISVRGGAPVSLCDVGAYRGAAWGDNDTIVFPTQYTSALYRIPAAGGTAQAATHLNSNRGETTQRWPQFLPDSKTVLFTASSNNNFYGNATVAAASLDTGEPKVLVENAYYGRYLPGGYLAYVSQGTLFVAPFDAQALKLTGTAIPVLQGIDADLSNGGVQFAVADNGMAMYSAGGTSNQNLNLVLLDRNHNSTVLLKEAGDFSSPRFSPDGKKIAFEKGAGGVWVYDIERGTTSAVTTVAAANYPVWTPDGQRLAYSYVPSGAGKPHGQRIFWKRADGTGEEEPLIPEIIQNSYTSSWTPDGKTLVYMHSNEKNHSCCDVWTVTLDQNGKPQEPHAFLEMTTDRTFGTRMPEVSPDGRWLAYASGESGLPQIYVVPFPSGEGKWQISPNGGVEPHWSRTGHELFYSKAGSLVVVPYTAVKNSFHAGTPQEISQSTIEMRAPYTSYDVAPDGQHFVAFQFPGGRSAVSLEPTVAINWLEEVRRLVASGQSGSK